MANTHAIPDSSYEMQAVWGDLGPEVIVSHSGLTVPASSLTLTAVAANGYVLASGPPARLVYVSQPAVSVTLSATNGTWWLAVHADLHTPVSGWTRRSGSHFLAQQAATQPANPSGGLVFAQLTVASLVISAVSPLLPVTSPPLSRQNSNAVAITGGDVEVARVGVNADISSDAVGMLRVGASAIITDTTRTSKLQLMDVGAGWSIGGGWYGMLTWNKGAVTGALGFHQTGGDFGAGQPMYFYNGATTVIGSISTTATGTAYNTTSDMRLKRNVAPLTAALERLRALRPVEFLWTSDDSPGVGFIAHEVQEVLDGVITGEAGALDEAGEIVPQQIDMSKLVPWLTAALKETLAQVEALTARVAALEAAQA